MKSLRVLIADDDGLTLMLLRKTLLSFGHVVVAEAGDGQQAIHIARETNPDLMILDVRMPIMDGFEAARQIRSQQPVPIVFLSAHTESGLGAEAAAVGANAYLVKPFTAEQLAPAIELALVNFEKSRQLEYQLQRMSEAMEARKVVERAKGILMRQAGLDEESAYLKLQRTARNENRKLVEVAREVVSAERPKPDSPEARSPHRRMPPLQ